MTETNHRLNTKDGHKFLMNENSISTKFKHRQLAVYNDEVKKVIKRYAPNDRYIFYLKNAVDRNLAS